MAFSGDWTGDLQDLVGLIIILKGVQHFLNDYFLPSSQSQYDGLFLSNGPGDPVKCAQTVDNLRSLLKSAGKEIKPIFGICLGHQLLGVAAGGKTYKLK